MAFDTTPLVAPARGRLSAAAALGLLAAVLLCVLSATSRVYGASASKLALESEGEFLGIGGGPFATADEAGLGAELFSTAKDESPPPPPGTLSMHSVHVPGWRPFSAPEKAVAPPAADGGDASAPSPDAVEAASAVPDQFNPFGGHAKQAPAPIDSGKFLFQFGGEAR